MMDNMKTIYIAHGYGDRNHFVAVYKEATKYGYNVSEQIVLANKAFFGKIIRCLIKGKFKEAVSYVIVKIRFLFLENQIIIVSLPAYDPALIKYKNVFEKNCCFFHSSHPYWDGSCYTKGNLRIREEFERILSSCFVGGFCVNNMAACGLKEFIHDYRVIYHAIECDKYKKKDTNLVKLEHQAIKEKGCIKYVYLGQFRKIKNAQIILNWLKNNPDANVSVTFIGKGELESSIIQEGKLDKRIVFKGYFDKKRIQEELCNYDYLILPSFFETLGIVLLEAMASGVPCIVSNVCGPLSVIKEDETGFFFDVEKGMEDFCEVMEKSMNISWDKYCYMSKKAIEESKNYDISKISQVWFSMINDKVNEYFKKEELDIL